MNHYIKDIHIINLLHLKDINIPLADEKCPNVIITGKNGSGKTILLSSLADNLQLYYSFGDKKNTHVSYFSQESEKNGLGVRNFTTNQYGSISCSIEGLKDNNFIIAFYQADRNVKMTEPQSPTKPQLEFSKVVRDTNTNQFLNFLSDLKIQEALARNEKKYEDADEINDWFLDFEHLLCEIFQDNKLTLDFHYKDYSFYICTDRKSFKFTELSDGYSAILDIVADLILKMQDGTTLSRNYKKSGIVLIDEVETHLHLELQKMVMPFLTKVFPNIQFIVTTHSPFVLSSMPNAVAYDLEHQKPVNNLAQYSYESLAEGYFGVTAISSDIQHRLNIIKELLNKEDLSVSEKATLRNYLKDFDNIPEAVSPSLIGEYLQTKLKHIVKIKELMQ